MKYRAFFSKDCMMWGVQELISNYGYVGEHEKWIQIPPPGKRQGARGGKSAYTCYWGVAERWVEQLNKRKDIV